MRRLTLATAMLLPFVAGCSDGSRTMERGSSGSPVLAEAAAPSAADNTAPQIAYSYALGYSLPADTIGTVQASHIALCRQLGPNRCRLVKTSLQRATSSLYDTTAATELLVDARIAGAFGSRLDAATTDAGGSVASRTVTAEDVTKQVIDVGARVRAKQVLADHLLQLINSANAPVGDLVAAEKAFSDAQEELDAARSLQATLSQRVRMSSVDISYGSTATTGNWAPVRRSLATVGETLASSIAALVTFVVAALPWVLLLGGLIWVMRRLRWRPRWPWRRRAAVD
ncbi:DUF4349 domain-containing protein [Sphingomonas sp.]|uniref:DUF4349 domain-containing protein n=1 Tax=Sphingomonas sp. TaxID=28214 RepID=UPI003B005002